jgi:hypothetical protein
MVDKPVQAGTLNLFLQTTSPLLDDPQGSMVLPRYLVPSHVGVTILKGPVSMPNQNLFIPKFHIILFVVRPDMHDRCQNGDMEEQPAGALR